MGTIASTCGIALMVNGFGVPAKVLEHPPFDTFLIPGILLAVVVGGSLLVAAWLVLIRHPGASLASIGAGAIQLGWILAEGAMVREGRALQITVLLAALAIIALGWRFLRSVTSQANNWSGRSGRKQA